MVCLSRLGNRLVHTFNLFLAGEHLHVTFFEVFNLYHFNPCTVIDSILEDQLTYINPC